MELKEMIKIMQHYADGGRIEFKPRNTIGWRFVVYPVWNWELFDYRIAEQKQKVTIEKWLIKDKDSGEHFIMESSDIDLTLQDYPKWIKLKLLESYEIELKGE